MSGSFTETNATANDGNITLPSAEDTTLITAPTASESLVLSGILPENVKTSSVIGSVTVTLQ